MTRRNLKDEIRKGAREATTFTSSEVAARLGISRQAAHGHLRDLVGLGELAAVGQGRGRRYGRPDAIVRVPREQRFRTEGLEEDVVWRQMLASDPDLRRVGARAQAIFQYALTKILNNAIEHSGAREVTVRIERRGSVAAFEIIDEGVGIFERVRRAYDLQESVHAIAELQKGKVTSDPERHTGEGIFFVSKAADFFDITSGGLRWQVDNVRGDNAVGVGPPQQRGTSVRFEIDAAKDVTLEEIFRPFAKEFAFDTTRILVRLFELGTRFISRSEARRLVHGLDRFREVILDFEGVEAVGQGFVDEVFRVWATAHREIALTTVNMSPPVAFMVQRAQSGPAG